MREVDFMTPGSMVIGDWNKLPDVYWHRFAWKWIWYAKEIDQARLERVSAEAIAQQVPIVGEQRSNLDQECQVRILAAMAELKLALDEYESKGLKIAEAG